MSLLLFAQFKENCDREVNNEYDHKDGQHTQTHDQQSVHNIFHVHSRSPQPIRPGARARMTPPATTEAI